MKNVLISLALIFSSASSLLAAPIRIPLQKLACEASVAWLTQPISSRSHGAILAGHLSPQDTYIGPHGCERELFTPSKHWILTPVPHYTSHSSTPASDTEASDTEASDTETFSPSTASVVKSLVLEEQCLVFRRPCYYSYRNADDESRHRQEGWTGQAILAGLFTMAAMAMFVSIKIMVRR